MKAVHGSYGCFEVQGFFMQFFCSMESVVSSLTFAAIDAKPILNQFGNAIYLAMAVSAIYGLYCIIALMRRIKQKSFPGREASDAFLDEVGELLEQNDFDGVMDACDTPEVWARAVPQLVQVAVENRAKPIKKVKIIVGEFFSREILAEFDARTSWVNTIVKAAPMLGLLGTVTGMIGAFEQIAGTGESGVNPVRPGRRHQFCAADHGRWSGHCDSAGCAGINYTNANCHTAGCRSGGTWHLF